MLTRFINVFQISHTLPWFDPLSESTSTAWFCEYEWTKIPPVGFCWMTHQSGRRVWYWVQKQNNMPSQQLLDLLWLSDRERTICRVNNCTACLESRAGSADLFHAAALTISVWHNQQKTLKVFPDNMWVWHNQLNPESGKGSVTVKNSDFFAKKKAPTPSTKWTQWGVFGCWPLRSFRAVFLQTTTQNPGHFECVTNNKNWSCMW